MIRPFLVFAMILLAGLFLAPERILAANIDVASTTTAAKSAVEDTAAATVDGAKTLKKAYEAQGNISPQTAHVIESMSGPPGAQFNKPDGGSGKGATSKKNSGKAIYGDIIIHR